MCSPKKGTRTGFLEALAKQNDNDNIIEDDRGEEAAADEEDEGEDGEYGEYEEK